MAKSIGMGEVKPLLNYVIDNNIKLQEKGVTPIAVGFEGSAGIGKTSIIQQVAEERGMQCTKISLHEMEEAGDLIGFPLKEYECQVGQKYKAEDGTVKVKLIKDSVWMNEKQLDNPPAGLLFKQTGKTRMAYAKPAWVPEYNEKGNLVILDDYVRRVSCAR